MLPRDEQHKPPGPASVVDRLWDSGFGYIPGKSLVGRMSHEDLTWKPRKSKFKLLAPRVEVPVEEVAVEKVPFCGDQAE